MKHILSPEPAIRLKFTEYLVGIVLVIVPFHAFLTVWLSSFLGHYTLLRLWDEALLLILVGWAVVRLVRDRELRRVWQANLLVRLILAYTVLTLLLGLVAYIKGEVRPEALAYGLLINLRYLAWFLATALLMQRPSGVRRLLWRLLLVPAAVVVLFGLLQYTVLPHNFLSHFGYNTATTIPPIETINHNPHYIRAQSTLRGANPLGAYLVIVLSMLGVLFIRGYRRLAVAIAGGAVLLTLYASGSRSAWIGGALAVLAAIWLSLKSRFSRNMFLAVATGVIVVMLAAGLLLRNQTGVENALLHTQKHSAVATSSNAAHASALRQGLSDVVRQPLGDGPGTAGQASAYNAPHPVRIAENYYVQIAQETGLLGAALFISILAVVGRELYRRRSSPLALAAFASLLGISFVCLLSHAWSDDTLAYTWWGLAALALSGPASEQAD